MEGVSNAVSNLSQFFQDAFDWLYEVIMYAVGYILGYLSQMQLKGFVMFQDFYDSLMSDLFNKTEDLYDLIKIADTINLFNQFMQTDACYIANAFLLPQWFMGIISAYLIRFGIRRLPFIG